MVMIGAGATVSLITPTREPPCIGGMGGLGQEEPRKRQTHADENHLAIRNFTRRGADP